MENKMKERKSEGYRKEEKATRLLLVFITVSSN